MIRNLRPFIKGNGFLELYTVNKNFHSTKRFYYLRNTTIKETLLFILASGVCGFILLKNKNKVTYMDFSVQVNKG